MSPLAIDRALRASDRLHLGNISSRCCSWASHSLATGGYTYTHSYYLQVRRLQTISAALALVQRLKKKERKTHQETENNAVTCAEVITLAVAPSVCVLRHCVSLPGGGSLSRVVSFNEISSVLDLGTSSLSAKKEKNQTQNNIIVVWIKADGSVTAQ